jgi:hypothetical protein
VDSVDELFNNISDFTTKLERKNKIWFRGTCDSSFDLTPSLQRIVPKNTSQLDMIMKEKRMLELFQKIPMFSSFDGPDWEWVYLMQHYGLKTRLLDWTKNKYVGLFFAIDDRKEDAQYPARLWMLDPELLNEIYYGQKCVISPNEDYSYFELMERSLVDNDIFAIEPNDIINREVNARINAQEGVFTLHFARNIPGPRTHALNLTLENDIWAQKRIMQRRGLPGSEGILSFVDLSPRCIDQVKDLHKSKGISAKELYPDFLGLSKYVNSNFDTI